LGFPKSLSYKPGAKEKGMGSWHVLIGVTATIISAATATPLNSAPALESSAMTPVMAMHGQNTKCTSLKTVRITSSTEWRSLWLEHATGDPDAQVRRSERSTEVEFDFERIMVIGVFDPNRDNSAGFTAYSVSESRNRIVIRLDDHSYQTLTITKLDDHSDQRGNGESYSAPRPWGIIALPRSGKEIVLELDDRAHTYEPPAWKEWRRIAAVKEEEAVIRPRTH
jgi:hypothetical protein